MYNFHLTEEIARWAFEIKCRETNSWYIAFTNPTAGPWKTIKGLDESQKEGEVYRFELEETRPDIILVNDTAKLILIIEAKDSLSKLTHENQAFKSVEVVNTLSKILKNPEMRANKFWKDRVTFSIMTGLLWGAEIPTNLSERMNTFDSYHSQIKKFPKLDQHLILGIETRRKDDGLQCFFCGKIYGQVPNSSVIIQRIANSFNVQML